MCIGKLTFILNAEYLLIYSDGCAGTAPGQIQNDPSRRAAGPEHKVKSRVVQEKC